MNDQAVHRDPSRDAVDDIREQWVARRPELDTEPIEIVGRILRASALIVRATEEALAAHGLSRGEFDILSALRRADAPRSPGTLRTIGLASGPATTKRLHALEGRGLVARSANPMDRRGALIALTASGTALIDAVFPDVLAAERMLLAGVPEEGRGAAANHLRALLASIEGRDAADRGGR